MDTQTFTLILDGNKTADVVVEEFHPVEPSAYVWEAGWTCYDLNTDTEYFVSQAGIVYKQPENRTVGICPVVKEQADKLEAEMAKWEEN
jgi:hypothetical protein